MKAPPSISFNARSSFVRVHREYKRARLLLPVKKKKEVKQNNKTRQKQVKTRAVLIIGHERAGSFERRLIARYLHLAALLEPIA